MSESARDQWRRADALAGAVLGFADDAGTTQEQKVAAVRQYLGSARVLAQDVWEAAVARTAGLVRSERRSDAFWAIAQELEDPNARGILTGIPADVEVSA